MGKQHGVNKHTDFACVKIVNIAVVCFHFARLAGHGIKHYLIAEFRRTVQIIQRAADRLAVKVDAVIGIKLFAYLRLGKAVQRLAFGIVCIIGIPFENFKYIEGGNLLSLR